ncbi:MAG: hypothetical protein H8E10_10705 [Desulfobacterales bacterium]|nr:hypothetical protein [Desulfobacterales bacterium]
MSDGFNKPQYHATRSKSAHAPAVGEEFEWQDHTLKCVVSDGGCRKCFFNYRFDEAKAQACFSHFCESETRQDRRNVIFIHIK